MLKFCLKVIAVLTVAVAALAALLYLDRSGTPEYIEIYSDGDEA